MLFSTGRQIVLQGALHLGPDPFADCHNDAGLVNIGAADAPHPFRRPSHQLADLFIDQWLAGGDSCQDQLSSALGGIHQLLGGAQQSFLAELVQALAG